MEDFEDCQEVDGDEDDLADDYEDDENDLEQGDPGVLKLLWHFLPSVIPLGKSNDQTDQILIKSCLGRLSDYPIIR